MRYFVGKQKDVIMKYFGVPTCPYCKKRVNLIRVWSLKKHGEYRCPRCKGISNIYLSPLVYVFAVIAIAAGFLVYFFAKFISDNLGLFTVLEVFLPFAAFFVLSLFFVYLEKPVIKKVRRTEDGRFFDEDGNELKMKMGKLVPAGSVRQQYASVPSGNTGVIFNQDDMTGPTDSELIRSFRPKIEEAPVQQSFDQPQQKQYFTASSLEDDEELYAQASRKTGRYSDDFSAAEASQHIDISSTSPVKPLNPERPAPAARTQSAQSQTNRNLRSSEQIRTGKVASERNMSTSKTNAAPNSGFEDLFDSYTTQTPAQRPATTSQPQNNYNRTVRRPNAQTNAGSAQQASKRPERKETAEHKNKSGGRRFRDL